MSWAKAKSLFDGEPEIKLTDYTILDQVFLGVSEGGIQTAMSMPRFRLMFDIGRGSPRLVEIPRILLTHGHLDHASGVPYHISQRSLRHLPGCEIFCPPELKEPLEKILELWAEIEGFRTEYALNSVDYGTVYPLQGNHYFKAVRTIHRIPSNAYSILEKTTKLKPEYKNLPGQEIARLKKEKDLFYEAYNPIVTFSGDTQIEFVLDNEEVRKSKILFLECTYVDEDRPVERARKWGHIHLFEIAEHAEAFRDVQKLVLIHFSPRYRPEKIRQAISQRLPGWLAEKTIPFLS